MNPKRIVGRIAFLTAVFLNVVLRGQTPGSLDLGFDPDTASANSTDNFWQMAIQTNGQILVVGRETVAFTTIYGVIYRLNTNGSRDGSFSSGQRASNPTSASPQITSALVQDDGNVLVGGYFNYLDGVARIGMARLDSLGAVDSNYTPSASPALVDAQALTSDGKTIVVGGFTSFMGTGQKYVARLNSDGTPDSSFNSSNGPSARVWCVAVDSDGKILIGGDFTTVNGYARSHIARLNTDGSVDQTFVPDSVSDTVNAIAVQSDGRIVIGGSFTTVGTANRSRVARLNSNGTVDSSFDPGTVCNAVVCAVAVQSNGKILAGVVSRTKSLGSILMALLMRRLIPRPGPAPAAVMRCERSRFNPMARFSLPADSPLSAINRAIVSLAFMVMLSMLLSLRQLPANHKAKP